MKYGITECTRHGFVLRQQNEERSFPANDGSGLSTLRLPILEQILELLGDSLLYALLGRPASVSKLLIRWILVRGGGVARSRHDISEGQEEDLGLSERGVEVDLETA